MFDASFFDLGSKLFMAIASGAVIGIERQIHNKHTKKKLGMRDYSLVSLLAFLSAFFSPQNPYLWSIAFIGIFLFALSIFIFDSLRQGKEGESAGVTTVLTLPIVFLVASMAVFDFHFWLIATLLFALLILLELKEKWHRFTNTLEKHEIIDFSILIAIAIIITPLIPVDSVFKVPLYDFSQNYFVFQSISLLTFWKVVIMVSIMSFCAHFITKYTKGRHALLFVSFFGGIISSLATILLFLKKNKEAKDQKKLFLAYVSATTGSLTKDFIILSSVVSFEFFQKMLLPFVSLIVLLASFTLFAFSKTPSERVKITDRPLPLSFIAKFSLVFAGVIVSMVFVTFYLGDGATVLASFLSGGISSAAALASLGTSFSGGMISENIMGISIITASVGSVFAKYVVVVKHVGIRKSLSFFTPIFLMIVVGFLTLSISLG